MNLPVDGFPFAEAHSFGDGRRKVDVELVRRLLPADQLNLCWVADVIPPSA